MHILTKKVESIITKMLPDKFALIFDGWSAGDHHFLAIFAIFNYKQEKKNFLLSISPLIDETSLNALEHVTFVENVLNVYGKTLANVCALIGDNCNTNKAVASLSGIPLIGCHSHLLNLAVKRIFFGNGDNENEHENENMKMLIQKVVELVKTLKTTKGAAFLRQYTDLKAIKKNETRWTSTYEMLERYVRLLPYLSQIQDPHIVKKFLNPSENLLVKELVNDLELINKMMKYLQRDDITLADARTCFDAVLQEFPQLSYYLSPNAKILHSPDFNMAIIKIQSNRAHELNAKELKMVEGLKSEKTLEDSYLVNDEPCSSILGFLREAEIAPKKKKKII